MKKVRVFHEGHEYTVRALKKVKREDPVWSGQYQLFIADGPWVKKIIYRFFIHDKMYRLNQPENVRLTGRSEESRRRQSFINHIVQHHRGEVESYIREIIDEEKVALQRALQLAELKERQKSDYAYWHDRGYTLADGESVCILPVESRDDWVDWDGTGTVFLTYHHNASIFPFRAYLLDSPKISKNRRGNSFVMARPMNIANGFRLASSNQIVTLVGRRSYNIFLSADDLAKLIVVSFAMFRYVTRIANIIQKCNDHSARLRKRADDLRVECMSEAFYRSHWPGLALRMERIDVFYPTYMLSEALRSEAPFWVGAVAQGYSMWLLEAYSPEGAVRSLRRASYTGRALQIFQDHHVETQAPHNVLDYLTKNARRRHFIPLHLIDEFKTRASEILVQLREPVAFYPRKISLDVQDRMEELHVSASKWDQRAKEFGKMIHERRGVLLSYAKSLGTFEKLSE